MHSLKLKRAKLSLDDRKARLSAEDAVDPEVYARFVKLAIFKLPASTEAMPGDVNESLHGNYDLSGAAAETEKIPVIFRP